MVLGIDDYTTYDGQTNTTNYLIFKKFMQRIEKNTYSKYQDALNYIPKIKNTKINIEKSKDDTFDYIFNNAKTIYFHGHSLDVTDKDILEDIFQIDEQIYENLDFIKIFYLDKFDKSQKIANIVKLISPTILTRRMNNKTIEFIEIIKG